MLKLVITFTLLISLYFISTNYNQKTECINPQEYGGYAYCTPPIKLLKSDDCQKLYGKEWSDTGGGRCQKKVSIPKPSFYYYPKSEEDCYNRGMKPRIATNGTLICHNLDEKEFEDKSRSSRYTITFEDVLIVLITLLIVSYYFGKPTPSTLKENIIWIIFVVLLLYLT